MKLTLIALALASSAWGSIIGVTGSGTFVNDFFDSVNGYSASFSGSDGINGFSINWDSGAHSPYSDGGVIVGNTNIGSGSSPSGANINGLHFSTGFVSFIIGGGTGSITGYDSALNPIVTLQLSAYLHTTSMHCDGADQIHVGVCSGTFAIVPTPEPTTWLLTGAGLALLWRRRSA